MKETFIAARNAILKIRDFAEEFPERADQLELFAFTEKPYEIDDLLLDLECAIKMTEEN